MNYLKKFLWFIMAVFTRLLPMIIFFLIHTFGEVYTFRWNPLDLLTLKNIPVLFGPYLYLYIALGTTIILLFFMYLPITARTLILGVVGAQFYLFRRIWENTVEGLNKPEPYKNFYMIIMFSLIVGFVLQVTWRTSMTWLKKKRFQHAVRERDFKKVSVMKPSLRKPSGSRAPKLSESKKTDHA